MKIVHDDAVLRKCILDMDIPSVIALDRITPVLCSYERGELLTGPHIRQQYLLFLVSGIVQIYGIGLDGRKIPVNLAKRGSIIGDVEFCRTGNSNLFSEAAKDVLCIGISVQKYRQVLENDARFLRFLLRTVSAKVYLTSMAESPAVSVEEKLLHYLAEECEDHVLEGIEHAALRLQCSRRQLQRVLKEQCGSGRIEKTGKGRYRLCGEARGSSSRTGR